MYLMSHHHPPPLPLPDLVPPPPPPLPPPPPPVVFERQETSANDVKERVEVAVRMAYINEALSNIKERIVWQRVGDACETGGRFIAGIATILAFASSTYKDDGLSFASGCVGTISVTVSVFGAYAHREARERLTRLNAVLRDVNVREVSDTPPLQD
jgi:hypothetical protein